MLSCIIILLVGTFKSVFDGQSKMCITDHIDIIKNANCSVEMRNFYLNVPLVTAFAGYLSSKNDHHIHINGGRTIIKR